MPKEKSTIRAYYDRGHLINFDTEERLNPEQLYDLSKTHEIRVIGGENSAGDGGELATGVAIPSYLRKSWDYLKDVRDFDFKETDSQKMIEACSLIYKFETVVGTAVDILADFAVTDFDITGVNEEALKLLNYVKAKINGEELTPGKKDYIVPIPEGMYAMSQEIALEWFIAGNVFPYTKWQSNVKIDGKEYNIPREMVLLNPSNVDIKRHGPWTGSVQVKYRGMGTASSSGDGSGYLAGEAPQSAPLGYERVVETEGIVDHRNIYQIKRKSRVYDMWGVPYIARALTAVKAKRKLRALHDSTIDGLINYLIIFKIGSEKPDSPFHNPPPARLAAFANLIKYPQASNALIWPHDIDVISVGPEGKILAFKDQFKEVDDDIIKALGIPTILIDGSGNATASWPSIMAVAERLEKVRFTIGSYFERLFKQILMTNGMLGDNDPKVQWRKLNLRDEQMIKTLLLSFYDRGLLPIERTLREAGYDFDEAVEQRKEEDKKKIDDIFERRDVPFSPTEDGKLPGDHGRPVDKTDTKDKTKTTTAKMMPTDKWEKTYADKFTNDIDILLGRSFDKIAGEKMKVADIDNQLLVAFIRIDQLADSYCETHYASIGGTFDESDLYYQRFAAWKKTNLDKIKDFVKSELHKHLSRNKTAEKDKYIIAGIKSEAMKRLKLFAQEALVNVRLAMQLNTAAKDGMVGAYVYTHPDTECDTCKEINGNWYKLDEIFSIMPLHPHQRFELKYTDSSPVMEGETKDQTPMQQDPQTKKKL